MKKYQLIGFSILFVAASLSICSVVSATSTATVAATVTVQNISLTVTTSGTIAWGTLAINTASSTHAAFTQTVQNNGNVAEDFKAEGMNSTPGAWVLGSTNGASQYEQAICSTGCTSAPTGYTALATSSQTTLASNIAAAGTAPMDLYILTPTSVSDYTQQTVNVTLTAVAH